MSKAAEELRDLLHIYNPHLASEFAKARGGVGVYISYRPAQRGRVYRSAAWQVIRPGFQTDPGNHWMDYGHKSFTVFAGKERAHKEQEARTWASNRYGVTEWAKVPGLGPDLYPKADADIIKAALKEARKAQRVANKNT